MWPASARCAYVKAVPARDRVMLVRVDALATPATAFEPDRKKLERAIYESQPGATALNLDLAFSFARQAQAQGGRRGGEIVLVGSGRIAETETPDEKIQAPKNLRYVPVADQAENCGLRKIGLRRSPVEADLWEIYVSARNYGTLPRTVTLVLGFGPSGNQAAVPVGTRQLVLPPGAEREAEFQFHTRAAGVLEAKLLPHDGFPDDDRAVLELPSQGLLRVTVYSEQPDLLRPALAANPRRDRGVPLPLRVPAGAASQRGRRVGDPGSLPAAGASAGGFHLDRSAGARLAHRGAGAQDRRAVRALDSGSSAGRGPAHEGFPAGLRVAAAKRLPPISRSVRWKAGRSSWRAREIPKWSSWDFIPGFRACAMNWPHPCCSPTFCAGWRPRFSAAGS